MRIAVSDGLGHGYAASAATERALDYIAAHPHDDIEAVLYALQPELKGTRGCALNLIDVDFATQTLRYITVGNITMRLLSDDGASVFPPQPGVLGMRLHNQPRVRQTRLHPHARLFVFTDGLSRRWSLDPADPLWQKDLSLLGALLMRDHQRDNDDATLLIYDPPAGPGS